MNACYDALDLPVIRGHAADPAVHDGDSVRDYATVLEDVAAFAGALHGLGVGPGDPVRLRLSSRYDELVALLGTIRLGALALLGDVAADGPVRILATAGAPSAEVTANILRGAEPEDETRDVPWDIALRAGRTNPAGAARETPEPPYRGASVTGLADIPGLFAALAAGEMVRLA